MKKIQMSALVGTLCLTGALILSGCGNSSNSAEATSEKPSINLNQLSLEQLTKEAKLEGNIQSVGMPDTWANWVGTWQDIEKEYGISHKDTDMSSAEEIALFEAEKKKPTKDIGDVGQGFGPIAEAAGLTLPYKTSYWEDIPDWAKDDDGDWVVGYYGTISFITNTAKVKNPPKSWEDLLNGDYKVTIGDVNAANQAQNAVLSAAIARGGDESNLDPGLELFKKLAQQGRLDLGDTSLARLEKGEIEVGLFYDFNALNYRDQIKKSNPNAAFDITIPSDGSIQSGYATIINRYAPHPHAAALAREYILSDAGQINLARGYARPIRKNVVLPDDVSAKLLPESAYKAVQPVRNAEAWNEATKGLGQRWQNEVMTEIK